MINITIIGGNGFIGQNLSEFFSKKGFAVTTIGRSTPQEMDRNPSVEYRIADVNETALLIDSCQDANVVIWLASSIVPAKHGNDLTDDFYTDIKPLISFLESSKQSNLKFDKFIYLSSGGTIYGDSREREPIIESAALSPISAYGLSKLVAEEYIHFLALNGSFEAYILRPSNVYGKYQNFAKPQGIVGFAFLAAINGNELVLYNGGNAIRDFIYIDDMAEAIGKMVHTVSRKGHTTVLNIGSSVPIAIKEVVSKIQNITGKKIKTVNRQSRGFDCTFNVLDISKIKNLFDWVPKTNLDSGLHEVWAWIRNNTNG